MPRAIWSGAISFGLVHIPVKLYPAIRRHGVSFNQLDSRTGTRIKQRRINAETGAEVPYSDIVKGYDLGDGRFVTVTDEELAGLDPEANRTIELCEFVAQEEIDPVFYDAAYVIVPDPVARKAYALLVRAMTAADRVGVARFVMRTKQYLAAMRPRHGHLVLSTMVYADEISGVDDLDGLEGLDELEVTEAELAMAEQLIDGLSHPFEPEKYHDTYREAVLALIERKAAGEPVVASSRDGQPDAVVDLMAALEASVAAARAARSVDKSA